MSLVAAGIERFRMSQMAYWRYVRRSKRTWELKRPYGRR
jgi:hypothetical protein